MLLITTAPQIKKGGAVVPAETAPQYQQVDVAVAHNRLSIPCTLKLVVSTPGHGNQPIKPQHIFIQNDQPTKLEWTIIQRDQPIKTE